MFDESLAAVAGVARDVLGANFLESESAIILRDVTGRLVLVLRREITPNQQAQLQSRLSEFAPYVDPTFPFSSPAELYDDTLARDRIDGAIRISVPDVIEGNSFLTTVVDRRLIGADWLRSPLASPVDAPLVAFISLKGGVGRSTALSVTALDLARRGKSVVAIDLDLEAPGIGPALLSEATLPEFGTLDFFVERKLGELPPSFLQRMVGVCPIDTGGGLVTVVPAIGRASQNNPENVLAKLARAYLDAPDATVQATFLDQVRECVEGIAHITSPDVILIDVRAGLHESSAASILGLGALNLLFAVDTTQTFEGYRFLLSGLRPVAIDADQWRQRLQMVHAKASADQRRQTSFRDRSFDLFAETVYDAADPGDEDAFNFDLDDEIAPHFAWPILNDSNFLEFDPIRTEDQISSSVYNAAFGEFIARLSSYLETVSNGRR